MRRTLVDAVPDATLRLPPQGRRSLAEFRVDLQQSLLALSCATLKVAR